MHPNFRNDALASPASLTARTAIVVFFVIVVFVVIVSMIIVVMIFLFLMFTVGLKFVDSFVGFGNAFAKFCQMLVDAFNSLIVSFRLCPG